MTERSYASGYDSFSPESVAPRAPQTLNYRTAAPGPEKARPDYLIQTLTWAILSVCLAVWAVFGFILWVPLLLRSMVRFSFSLSQSMLRGVEPVEAGRILRDTVSFYRRGFVVAVEAVFGSRKKEAHPDAPRNAKAERLSPRYFVTEVLWAAVIWYLILYALGVTEVSALDGWARIWGLPWAEYWNSVTVWFDGLVRVS